MLAFDDSFTPPPIMYVNYAPMSTPKVKKCGLANRLYESGVTVSGIIAWYRTTPCIMAPTRRVVSTERTQKNTIADYI